MPQQFQTIGLIGKLDSSGIHAPLNRIIRFLQQRKTTLVVADTTAAHLKDIDCQVGTIEEIGQRCDLVVVMGGDGTMLSAARQLAAYRVPIIGINLGRLGFLTDIPADVMEVDLAAVLDGAYTEEERLMLAVVVGRKRDKIFRTVAFNDVVVSRGGMGSMIEFEVYVDGKFVYMLRSDGLIVCTPTGSTAYALSSGGPILHPSLPAMALVPIAPHTLSNRPIVLPKSATVTVVIVKGQDPRVNFDVQSHFELQVGDKVEIKANRHPIRLLHPEGYSYFAMLREKLHWSEKL
ncbi:MAG: NAD kinase [Pseudomonadota bacterium]